MNNEIRNLREQAEALQAQAETLARTPGKAIEWARALQRAEALEQRADRLQFGGTNASTGNVRHPIQD